MPLADARDTPACRALGRAWWKRHGKTIVSATHAQAGADIDR